MFFSRLFRHMDTRVLPQAESGQKGMEHLAPEDYFNRARIQDLEATLGRLDIVNIQGISPIE